MDLSADEKDTYERWKKKRAPEPEKDKEREYAVKKAKQEKTTQLVTEEVAVEVRKLVADGASGAELQAEAVQLARGAWARAVAEDMTGTLKPAARAPSTRWRGSDVAQQGEGRAVNSLVERVKQCTQTRGAPKSYTTTQTQTQQVLELCKLAYFSSSGLACVCTRTRGLYTWCVSVWWWCGMLPK